MNEFDRRPNRPQPPGPRDPYGRPVPPQDTLGVPSDTNYPQPPQYGSPPPYGNPQPQFVQPPPPFGGVPVGTPFPFDGAAPPYGIPQPTARPSDTVPRGGDPRPDYGASPGEQRIEDYRILRKLGEGGMGSVYLAEDERLGRKVAIKTMRRELAADPASRARFFREAKAAAAVEHDNVVPIWRIGEAADGSPFIAMPFLVGESLEDLLEREPQTPLRIVLKVAREVAEGLGAAHARGLIHRDIKPDNVWLEGEPAAPDPARRIRRCKILDFGLARSFESDDLRVTATGALLGTPRYMSPEQARGTPLDARTDLFSLGVMLYRMTTGRFPFEGPTVMSVLTALATVQPPAPKLRNPTLPQPLSDLIERLLRKDRDARPASAEEVATLVGRIEESLGRSPAGASNSNLAPPIGTFAPPPLQPPAAYPPPSSYDETNPFGSFVPSETSRRPASRSRLRTAIEVVATFVASIAAFVLFTKALFSIELTEAVGLYGMVINETEPLGALVSFAAYVFVVWLLGSSRYSISQRLAGAAIAIIAMTWILSCGFSKLLMDTTGLSVGGCIAVSLITFARFVFSGIPFVWFIYFRRR